MRFHPRSCLIVICGLLAPCLLPLHASDDWRPLWNGKDFTGWHHWLGKLHGTAQIQGDADPYHVFTIAETDGRPALHISGQVFGGLITDESFSHYRLKMQFKWGEKRWPPRENTPRDAGLVYDIHSEMNFKGRTWPRSLEFQIQEGDVGDVFALNSAVTVPARLDTDRQPKPLWVYFPDGAETVFQEKKPIGNRCCHGTSHEADRGQWNQLELICDGQNSVHIVNGSVVMRLHDAQRLDGATPQPLTGGQILLQSEGAEVYYRDIEIKPES